MPFVPDNFAVPISFTADTFTFKKLCPKFAEEDYQAVMESVSSLKGLFGEGNDWPPVDLTFDENYSSLKLHEEYFKKRQAFAYSVFSSDGKYLGCVYIYPSQNPEFDALVFYWIRDGARTKKLDEKLYSEIKHWLGKEWCFRKVQFPKK